MPLPKDQYNRPQVMAFYDVHGDLVAWQWLTLDTSMWSEQP